MSDPQTFTVEVTVTTDGSTDSMRQLLAAYLTQPDSPFIADYGPDAWGGYDGPKVTAVSVAEADGQVRRWVAPVTWPVS